MNPATHFLTGWAVANSGHLEQRERAAVTLAGVVPDVDGAGIIAEALTKNSAHPLLWWSDYHHILGHNLLAASIAAGVACAATGRRARVAALAFLSFHLHLAGDIVGGRGPDGYPWPIAYLYPFSATPRVTWAGQWLINAWPNFAITVALLALTFALAARRGYSPLEMISTRADAAFVAAIRARF